MPRVGSSEELRARLLWLTVFRVVANVLSLTVVALRQALDVPDEPSRAEAWGFGIIAVIFAATLVYASRLRKGDVSRTDAWVQVVVDVAFASGIVWLTGWGESPFIITYSLAIIGAAMLFQTRGALVIAALSEVAFSVIVYLSHVNRGPLSLEAAPLHPERVIFILVSNGIAFFLVAVLAGYLSRQLVSAGGRLVEREEDLRQLSNLHQQILAAMPSGLVTADGEGRITFVNPTAEGILGRRDLLGQELRESLPGVATLGRQATRRELRVTTPLGSRVLGLSVTGLDGDEGASLIVFQDLTELRRLEVELRKADQMAALGRMAAQLAHEIRNPLASMRGAAQMLGQGPEVDERVDRLTRILVRESDRLSRLVEDVLRFSRPYVPKRSLVDVGALAGETCEMLREDPLTDGIHLEVETDSVIGQVDPDQLRQVLLNLLRNALQAAGKEGRVQVSVTGTREMAIMRVRDSGHGMEDAVKARLFEPFFTTKQGGTGLGLATAHAMIHAHGGQLVVHSSPGEGTEFEIRLPLVTSLRLTPIPEAADARVRAEAETLNAGSR